MWAPYHLLLMGKNPNNERCGCCASSPSSSSSGWVSYHDQHHVVTITIVVSNMMMLVSWYYMYVTMRLMINSCQCYTDVMGYNTLPAGGNELFIPRMLDSPIIITRSSQGKQELLWWRIYYVCRLDWTGGYCYPCTAVHSNFIVFRLQDSAAQNIKHMGYHHDEILEITSYIARSRWSCLWWKYILILINLI